LTAKLARRFKVPVTNQKNLEQPLTAAGVPYCPGVAILNNGPAYSPATNLVYINSQDWCNIGFKRPAKYIAGIQYNGGSGRRDPLDESFGWTSAIDASAATSNGAIDHRRAFRCSAPSRQRPATFFSPAIPPVTFSFSMRRAATCCTASTPGGVLGGGVATYTVKGRQFVAVMSGNTSFHPYKAAGAATVLIFGL